MSLTWQYAIIWVEMFQFPTTGKAYPKKSNEVFAWMINGFQFPTTGKAYPKMSATSGSRLTAGRLFQFPTTGKAYPKYFHCCLSVWWKHVSIPYDREGISKETPFCTQAGRGSGYPKTKRELRRAFFAQKFISKIPQTLMDTDPNAIFQQNRYGSQSTSMFLDELSRAEVQEVNRACFYKYTLLLHISQIFCDFSFENRCRICYYNTTKSMNGNRKT